MFVRHTERSFVISLCVINVAIPQAPQPMRKPFIVMDMRGRNKVVCWKALNACWEFFFKGGGC